MTKDKVIEQMREALDELSDLVEASLRGEYTPDSFTTQPARNALAAAKAVEAAALPVSATPEMIAAAETVEDLYRRGTPETWGKVWKAMLAAAPRLEVAAKAISQALREKNASTERQPLTSDEVKAICSEAGYTHESAQAKADFINGLRHGERHHGITGGQR